MEINKGIEPFEATTDFTRGNKERKPWGRGETTDQFHLGSEYDVKITETPAVETPEQKTAREVAAAEAEFKFKHKLADGTELKAKTIEELAAQIEKAVTKQTPAAALEFEDKPLYVPLEFKRKELTLAEQADILNLWKENPQLATRKLQEAEFGASIDVILQNLSRAELRELHRLQDEAGLEFLMECEDYNPTRANAKKLGDYLKSKGKPVTKQNLVLSFQQLVAAGDKSLVKPAETVQAVEENVEEVLPPPTIVPSNQGRTESAKSPEVDAAKFAALPLDQQKKFFADLRRQ